MIMNYNKDCQTRIDKANSVFEKLKNVWKNKNISLKVEIILRIKWPCQHRCLVQSYERKSWKLLISGTIITGKGTKQINGKNGKMGLIVREREREKKLRWLGHVLHGRWRENEASHILIYVPPRQAETRKILHAKTSGLRGLGNAEQSVIVREKTGVKRSWPQCVYDLSPNKNVWAINVSRICGTIILY